MIIITANFVVMIVLFSTIGETGLVYSGYMYGEFVAVKTSKGMLQKLQHHEYRVLSEIYKYIGIILFIFHLALPSTESNKQLAKEASIMLSLIHPNVMPLIAISLDALVPLLIMPFMIHGTLLQHLRRHKSRLHHTEEDEGIEQVRANSDQICAGFCLSYIIIACV